MAKIAELKRNCELCNDEAVLFCPSDSAFLCQNCDAKVHSANFLVARHFRSSICRHCRNFDGYRFSGATISLSRTNPCRSCSPELRSAAEDNSDSLSSSSSCVSSTTEVEDEAISKKTEKISKRSVRLEVDSKVEGILVNWCRRMGLEGWKSKKVVPTAVEVLGVCFDKMTVLPFRVSLATSFWCALRILGSDTCQDLRRVEQISGVPLKLILATEERIARVIKRGRSRDHHEEGWAEC